MASLARGSVLLTGVIERGCGLRGGSDGYGSNEAPAGGRVGIMLHVSLAMEGSPYWKWTVAGTYRVRLTVVDDDGVKSSVLIPVTVH